MKERMQNVGKAVYFFVLYLLCTMLAVFVLTVFLNNINPNVFVAEYPATTLLAGQLLTVLALLLSAWLRKRNLLHFAYLRPVNKNKLLFSAGIGLFCGMFFACMLELLSGSAAMRAQLAAWQSMRVNEAICFYLLQLLVAPLFYELLFRGLIFTRLCRAMPMAAAVAVQAVLFAFTQRGSVATMVLAAAFGVISACVMLWYRSVLPGMLLHIGMRIGVFMLPLFGYLSVPLLAVAAVLSGVVCIAGAMCISKTERGSLPRLDVPLSEEANESPRLEPDYPTATNYQPECNHVWVAHGEPNPGFLYGSKKHKDAMRTDPDIAQKTR